MTHGYVYVLTNSAMPGIVKIGRTERDPMDRARELRTTGVPVHFQLAQSWLVDDCEGTEEHIHSVLAGRGVRTLPDREFFEISPSEAINLIDLVAAERGRTRVDFSRQSELAELMHALRLPIGREPIPEAKATHLADQLSQIGRQGYPNVLKKCAEIFEINFPSTLLFREFWQEYLTLTQREVEWKRLSGSNGRFQLNAVGRDAAEYLERLCINDWILPSDFVFVSSFLVSGERFAYEGYFDAVRRPSFPATIRKQAVAL